MIFGRPLKRVKDKIVPFNKDEKISPDNLGSNGATGKFLNFDGQWVFLTGSDLQIDNFVFVASKDDYLRLFQMLLLWQMM